VAGFLLNSATPTGGPFSRCQQAAPFRLAGSLLRLRHVSFGHSPQLPPGRCARETARQLARLTDRELSDIGLTRGGIPWAARQGR
jgi:hypothetical protein